ncbi:spore germination protein [Paenibacillus alginolyticus]|uniref:spore germination protein n=1 Tax=Paenibacillus alginolyticus TaxID=59839 RepID=UPI00041B0927|nr:spore germination protein [Paenibacillus alginolyticus]MCY9666763.1 spore germination protein [Paenibacillus alginolyticus]
MFFRNLFKKHKTVILEQQAAEQQAALSSDLNQNLQVLRSVYTDCSDVLFRPFLIGGEIDATLIYIEGMSNVEELESKVLFPLMQETTGITRTFNELMKKKLSVANVKEAKTITDCIEHISIGNPVMLIEGGNLGFALGLAKWEKRSVEEPTAEAVIRGPRDGFTETLGVNTSLIRRKLKSPQLKIKSMKVGRYTQTEVVFAYIEGIADKTLIEEVSARLQRIEIDGILESGYIEEMIEDNPFSPFPQVLNTERPDVVVSNLLEGRVAILVDGTPFAMVVPITIYSLLQSSEDYYQRFMVGTAVRWLRYLFLVVSLMLPSLYVAALTYHQEMVPTKLLLSMASSREQVPFPALVEALIMEITFEALREAGTRLPKQVGAAVSIVGALVIGQAAVQAGIVSAPMVMVVAITGIASFTIPRYTAGMAIRMLRFPMMILAGTLGFLGVMLGCLIILIHLCSLRSFGIPYLSPMAPMKGRDLKDVLIRAPWWMMKTRPHLTGSYNKYRQAPAQGPSLIQGDDIEEKR